MTEWTSDAQEYLDGYLRQVAALARARGDEADEIVGELQAHVVQEAERAAGSLVTMEHLRKVLVAIGTPEQVAGGDSPFAGSGASGAAGPGGGQSLEAPPPFDPSKAPPPPQPQRPVIVQPPAKSNAGCWVAAAIVGVVLFFVLIAAAGIMAAILLPSLSRAREAARRASCQNNLKQVGIVFKMFANESRGELYPELSPEPGRLMFANESSGGEHPVYPEYLTDATILMCPSDMDWGLLEQEPGEDGWQRLLDDHSYFYLGYAVMSDAEMAAFAEAYGARVAAGLRFDEDLEVDAGTGTAGGGVLYRLREGIARVAASDPQSLLDAAVAKSQIPVLIERTDNHLPPGGNVLFMDGHVEFIRYPGKWPMTEETVEILEALDAL